MLMQRRNKLNRTFFCHFLWRSHPTFKRLNCYQFSKWNLSKARGKSPFLQKKITLKQYIFFSGLTYLQRLIAIEITTKLRLQAHYEKPWLENIFAWLVGIFVSQRCFILRDKFFCVRSFCHKTGQRKCRSTIFTFVKEILIVWRQEDCDFIDFMEKELTVLDFTRFWREFQSKIPHEVIKCLGVVVTDFSLKNIFFSSKLTFNCVNLKPDWLYNTTEIKGFWYLFGMWCYRFSFDCSWLLL